MTTATTKPKPKRKRGRARTIADRLRQSREKAGLSRRGVEMAAGIGGGVVTRIELGTRIPGVDQIEKIAKAVNVSAGWLAFGEQGGREAGVGLELSVGRRESGVNANC